MQEHSVNSTRLSALELAAWRGFLRAHSALVRELDASLQANHDLSLHEYEVLLVLAGRPESRIRMTELAASVLLSQSGLTRLVDRLVRAGAVERTPSPEDRRGLYAGLTASGRAWFEQARPTHLEGVRSAFLDRFDAEELQELASYWERLAPRTAAE